MTDYRDEIIDHYKNPRNFGEMADADTIINEANSSCGDVIKIFVRFEGEKIADIKWQGVGCAISTASASMLSEKAVGMTQKDVKEFGGKGVVDMLGGEINAGRMKCAMLPYNGLLKVFEKNV